MRARRLIRGLGGVPEFRVGAEGSETRLGAKKMVLRMTVRLRTKDVGRRVEAVSEPAIRRGKVTHGD